MMPATILLASDSAITTIWVIALVIALVVTVVVAVLLEWIRRTAKAILGGASAIWTHGQLVANNTIQLPVLLPTTNDVAGLILKTAGEIKGATAMIEQHAEGCPGCPHCALNGAVVLQGGD